jgi:copper chaperone NosL
MNSMQFTGKGGRWPVAGGWWVVVSLFVLAVLGGCAKVDMDAPPEIVYGRDICSRCGMIIEDARFAAGYLTEDGEPRIFDDIGGMLRHEVEQPEAIHARWVHDYETEAWLRAEEAFFVLAPEIHTPMGFGVVALADEGRATAVALRHNGKVLTYAELQGQSTMLKANHTGHSHMND